mmetsp:Transcript_7575/g.27858  ORF Transcript_7575/g.27858 Transcript_7575/m.27858 type:complete len:408 (+) Transcript_7575:139-1362(+)
MASVTVATSAALPLGMAGGQAAYQVKARSAAWSTCRASRPSSLPLSSARLSTCKQRRISLAGRTSRRLVVVSDATTTYTLPDISDEKLAEHYLAGPLASSSDASNTALLRSLADRLGRHLGWDVETDSLDQQKFRRLFHYYIPTYLWAKKQLAKRQESGDSSPLVVSISAPQGCGKTTLVTALQVLFTQDGITPAIVSLDDFYLTYEEQCALAASFPGNELLEFRGNAGTQDQALMKQTISSLRSGTPVKIPRYDKSQHGGRGDRVPESEWETVSNADIVLLEGWMLGFSSLPKDEVTAVDERLVPVNEFLEGFQECVYDQTDCWMVLQVADPNFVYEWRLQAEHGMRARGKPGLSDDQVADFVSRFMPAYQAYLPKLYKDAPPGGVEKEILRIAIDRDRNVMEVAQ